MNRDWCQRRWWAAGAVVVLLGLMACDLEPTPTPSPLPPTATPLPTIAGQPVPTWFRLPLPINTTSPPGPPAPPLPTPPPPPTFPPPPTETPVPPPPTETLGPERPAWQRTTLELQDLSVLANAPNDTTTIYVGGAGSLYRTSDGGDSWVQVSSAFTDTVLWVAPSDPRILYAGAGEGCPARQDSRLRRSTDGGASWTPVQGGADHLDINPTDPNHLISLWCDGVYRSSDGGQGWTRLPGSEVPPHFQADFGRGSSNRGYIYVSYTDTSGEIRIQRTTDDARSWQTLPPTGFHYLNQLVVDPKNARWLYLLTGDGFHVSTDAGTTWRTANDGLEPGGEQDPSGYSGSIGSLVVDQISRPPPGAHSTLYVGNIVFEGARQVNRWNGKDKWELFTYSPYGDPPRQLLMVNDPARPVLLVVGWNGLYRVFLR